MPILLIVLVSAFSTANAQTKFGIKAGMSFSNITDKAENGDKAGHSEKLDHAIPRSSICLMHISQNLRAHIFRSQKSRISSI